MTDSVLRQSRDISIDYSRGIGIILVILAHGLEMSFNSQSDNHVSSDAFYAWRSIYSFHMPLFYFLSGVVVDKTKSDYIRVIKRCVYLILLALTFHAAISVLHIPYLSVIGYPSPLQANIAHILRPFVKGDGFDPFIVWFLVSISFVQLGAFIMYSNNAFGKALVWVVIIYSIMCTLYDAPNFWQIRSFAPGLMFFVFGMHYRQTQSRYVLAYAVIYGCLCVLTGPLNHGCVLSFSSVCPDTLYGNFAVWLIIGKIGYAPLFIFTAITGVLAVHGFAQFAAWNISYPAPVLSWVGRNSLELMLVNGVFIDFINPHLGELSFYNMYIFGFELSMIIISQVLILAITLPLFKMFESFVERLADWTVKRLPLQKATRACQSLSNILRQIAFIITHAQPSTEPPDAPIGD
ncbi:MAG: acyltransferase family protein [Methylocystis sp.]